MGPWDGVMLMTNMYDYNFACPVLRKFFVPA